ncbi:MAG: DNA repair protein RecN [Clostridia bacterium]|nr:DNA repair protein RecN [Clostridia bacterium]
MLQTLNIQNVALIDKLALNFVDKLNVISGETGAGKSIMLDSLSFVFGGRADKTLIRSGENKMKVEAIFSMLDDNQKEFVFNEVGIKVEDEIFISRELDIQGKNICKINGELIPVATLKKLCLKLIDIHGQSEHLAILDNNYQLNIIDNFNSESNNYLQELFDLIENVKSIEKQIEQLGGNEIEKQNLIDLYRYQLQELNEANIKENEFEELSNEKKEMAQYEKINENLKLSFEKLSKNNFSESASEQIYSAIKSIQNVAELNDKYKNITNRLDSVLIEIEDINEEIQTALRNNVFDQDRFEFIDNRLDLIKSLFRKYGGDFNSLQKYKDDISNKLDFLINGAEKYAELTDERSKIVTQILSVQDKLSLVRKKSADKLIKELEIELKNLGMPNARMGIEFTKIDEEYSYSGYDRVELMFSSNLGFELRPLNKVVSGGEMSRVMLAYKIVVAGIDHVKTIIFDEIDTGLSGNIATVVAEYMARLSKNKQIIAVSHLPQICAMADENIKVEKFSIENTTKTNAKILVENDLYFEIARLMGVGKNENGINVAKELKINSNNYKNNLKN